MARRLAGLGIHTVEDLLRHYPRTWLDRTRPVPAAEAAGREEAVLVEGLVKTSDIVSMGPRLVCLKTALEDPSGILWLEWIRPRRPGLQVLQALRARLRPGTRVRAWGRAEKIHGRLRMAVDDYEVVGEGRSVHFGGLIPVHPATEGVSPRRIREWIGQALPLALPEVRRRWEWLPPAVRRELDLEEAGPALAAIHFPPDPAALSRARRRWAFEEAFLPQVAIALGRKRLLEIRKDRCVGERGRAAARDFLASLPFSPTQDQAGAVEAILSDLASPRPMNRLLQGEVGSGKTVVALAAAVAWISEGFSACLMAPTEILAEQHRRTIQILCPQMRLGFFRGGMTPRQKAAMRRWVGQGPSLLLGTHALLEEGGDAFRRSRLVVVDEQHRFGVAQRKALRERAHPAADVLVMTATPIPRTLQMTFYGDLEVTSLRQMPPGRRPVATRLASEEEAYEAARREAAAGGQVFVVFPAIEESEKMRSLEKDAALLAKREFSDLSVGFLHGRMSSLRKEQVMRAFAGGEFSILISTTVVEVGIDVPNATLMVVENAERYGLATLHQLRGRVGRGDRPGTCLLLAHAGGEEAARRLAILCETNDGFRIAEEDWRIRGPGEIFGTAQHGEFPFRLLRPSEDADLLERAGEISRRIAEEDPDLARPEHAGLREMFRKRYGEKQGLERVA